MKVPHWRLITELRTEIAKLLDRTLVLGSGGDRNGARQHTRYLRDEVARTAYVGSGGRTGDGVSQRSGFVERLRLGAGDHAGAVPKTLSPGSAPVGRGATSVTISPELLARLREDLLCRIENLEEKLSKELSEGDVGQMIFPLVLLCDEMVMVRLAKEQHTLWHLLQTELFRINYGGDVFYDFADEQLDKANTSVEVFEVLYYCLQSGFVGRFGFDSSKVQRYRNLLSERILALAPADRASLTMPSAAEHRPGQRTKATSRSLRAGEARARSSSRARYYGWAIAMVAVSLILLLFFTNT